MVNNKVLDEFEKMEFERRVNDTEMHEGNLFFKHKYPTNSLENFLRMAKSFEEFEKICSNDLMNENLLMGDFLYHLLDKYDVSPNKASLEIGRSHSYVRKIVNGKELNPSRDVLLAICVLIGATTEETQILLRYSGKAPLYARRKRDVIIWYALEKIESLIDLNCYLSEKGYETLSKIIHTRE